MKLAATMRLNPPNTRSARRCQIAAPRMEELGISNGKEASSGCRCTLGRANHQRSCRVSLKVLDPILWSTLHFSTPLRPNHRRHTFTTAATVCLGCGLSLNITCETYNLHWALRVTCTIEMFVTPSSTHVVLFIH